VAKKQAGDLNMPTIDINYQDIQRLLNLQLNCDLEKLDDILAFIKAEVKGFDQKEGILSIEMKDTNRPDLWSIEGLTRALQGYLNLEKGIKHYSSGTSIAEVNVNPRLWGIRPFIACSIIKDINLSDDIIKRIMHLQDKLDQTNGRNRQKTSIGIYNFDLIKPPIEYSAVKPMDTKFVPLGFIEEMSLNEILERHPKGVEYAHIVKRNPLYPMLFDSDGKVLSFPPIINSNDLGKITEDSRNLLIEVTGTLNKTVLNTLNLVTLALIDHGGKAYGVTINYPKNSNYTQGTLVTPDFSNKSWILSIEETNRILGLQLSSKEISQLLLIAGLGVEKADAKSVSVIVPCYRVDVMHQVDIIEDIAIAYGYNNIEPVWRELPTTGSTNPDQHLVDVARELMIGIGYQETLNTTLTNQISLFAKMNVPPTKHIELSNPKVVTMTCLRNCLLPSIMEFLSINQSVEFPQKIFELGKVSLLDESKETRTLDENWIAAATTHVNANFTEIKSALDSFMANMGMEWQIKEITHPTFIDGRVGKVMVKDLEIGVIGEVNPLVLELWKLENPVACFEINFQAVISSKHKKPSTHLLEP
jgi:phenylalanyl-tRNA synthetase beta chain